MKEKLQRDLRWVKKPVYRFIVAGILGLVFLDQMYLGKYSYETEIAWMYWGIGTVLAYFIVLYLFIAWLYPKE